MTVRAWIPHAMHAPAEPGPAVISPPAHGPTHSFHGDIPRSPEGFTLLEEIGRGGMGIVYRARQERVGRDVAIKILPESHQADPVLWARFQAEGEAMARLQHPHIVQLIDAGELNGGAFLALEYMAGGSLAQRLTDFALPALDPNGIDEAGRRWTRAELQARSQEIAALLEPLCRAAHHAHRHGIVHRDLKPANVLLTRDQIPKLTDFGLALETGGAEASTPGPDSPRAPRPLIVGTPSYIGPEQAQCRADLIGPATDIYALGAILYELLTRRPPFVADTTVDTLLQVVMDAPVPPRQRQPAVAPPLESICLRCLHKNPAERYPTALALAEDLKRYRLGLEVQGMASRRRPWRRQFAANTLAAAAGFALGAWLVVLGGMFFGREAAIQERPAVPLTPRVRATPPQAASQASSAFPFRKLAEQFRDRGQLKEAEEIYCLGLAELNDPVECGILWTGLGQVLAAGNFALEAEEAHRKAVSLLREAPHSSWLAEARIGQAEALLALNQLEEADAAFRESISLQEAASDTDLVLLARARRGLGSLLVFRNHPEEAARLFRQALDGLQSRTDIAATHERVAVLVSLGDHLRQNDRWSEAEAAYRAALAQSATLPSLEGCGQASPQAAERLANLLRDLGRHAEATALRDESRRR